jgi:hypothetical protein
MLARIVDWISSLGKKSKFPKKLRPSARMQQAAAGSGTIHDEAILEWARGLAIVLFLVFIILVISIADK